MSKCVVCNRKLAHLWEEFGDRDFVMCINCHFAYYQATQMALAIMEEWDLKEMLQDLEGPHPMSLAVHARQLDKVEYRIAEMDKIHLDNWTKELDNEYDKLLSLRLFLHHVVPIHRDQGEIAF
jgi:hypothetical protein